MSFTAPRSFPASVRIFKSGTTCVAETFDGKVLSTNADAAIPINSAINNIPGATTRGYGGKVFIHAGDYDCKTSIVADVDTTTYHGVELEGEGLGTRINFTPSSALTDGIRTKMIRPRLANMRIYANANVTNVIHITGRSSPERNDYGILENLQIDGAPATQKTYGATLGLFTANQKGIFMDASNTRSMYWWKAQHIDFRGLDIGMHLFGSNVTSILAQSISGVDNNVGIKVSGGQNKFDEIWFQGSGSLGVGKYGVWFTDEGVGEASLSAITNLQVEAFNLPGAESAALCIDKGVSNVDTANIRNVSATDSTIHHSILDKNVRPVNHHADWDLRRDIHTMIKTGHWQCGVTPVGLEDGFFRRSIVESPGTFLTANTSNGPKKALNTTAAVNNISSIYYNKHDGYAPRNTSNFSRADSPKFTARFLPLNATDMRVFIGLWNSFAAPTSTADMLNAKAGVGLWLDTGVSNNWQIMHNDNAGASTVAQIGAGIPITVDIFKVEIILNDSTGKAAVNLVSDTNAWTSTIATTNLPDTSYQLGWLISLENLGTGKTISLYDIDLEAIA